MSPALTLDPTALERLCRLGGNKFAGEMITLFLDYAAKKVAEARAAEASGDLLAVQKAVHPLRSSAGNVGAARVQQLADRLESEAGQGAATAVALDVVELERAFTAASAELTTARQQLTAPAPAPAAVQP